LRVVAVYSIKGGVGKTTTAVNLAHLSATSGARTLLWDLDPQGAATFYFRVQPHVKGGVRKLVRGRTPLEELVRETDYEGLDLLPSDFSYRNLDLALDATPEPRQCLASLIRPLSRGYDHVYLDCAPSISLVSEGIFAAADTLLVPTLPSPLSMRTLDQLAEHLARERRDELRVLPFFCMVDRRKTLHREIAGNGAGAHFPFLASQIPYSSTVERMGVRRAPLGIYAAGSEAATAYEALWRELMERTGSMLVWLGALRRAIGRVRS
jgi:cellulose biosynthesis protein BcsQ